MGVRDIIAFDVDEYVDKAVALAANRDRIANLRKGIPVAIKKSIVTDPILFARHMEQGFVQALNEKFPDRQVPAISTASLTVLKTGRSRCVEPPLPGVTPPTTFVPYSIIWVAWKVPSVPVKPCTIILESLLTKTLMVYFLLIFLFAVQK